MAETSSKTLPDYDRPPVIEVVSGIMFQPIKALAGPYLGVLWEKFKPDTNSLKKWRL